MWQRKSVAPSDYLQRRASYIDAWMRLWDVPRGRALEIGGAGLPAVDLLAGFAERHAVDPLMEDYETFFGARGHKARAEALPFADDHFDTVLMFNVLDHVDDPARALAETARVLDARHGMLFFSCDIYSRTWLALRSMRIALKGRRNNDWLHPHHFTAKSLWRLFAAKFDVLEASDRSLDPLLGENTRRASYLGDGWRTRLKRESRLYFVARPRS